MYYRLVPSILTADFTRLGEQVKEVYGAGVEYLHLGMMDETFVPSISFGIPVIKSSRPYTRAAFGVHMMVEGPGRYVEGMKNCGADIIAVQAEACAHLDRAVNQVKEAGLEAGMTLNPTTPVHSLECVLGQLGMALIMTVNPGFGERKLISYTLDRIRKLKNMPNEQRPKTDIQVDDGVNAGNIQEIMKAGTNMSMAGSVILGQDPFARIREFMDILGEYER